jgi:hypothetical protein
MTLKQIAISCALVLLIGYIYHHGDRPLTILSGGSVAAAGSEATATAEVTAAISINGKTMGDFLSSPDVKEVYLQYWGTPDKGGMAKFTVRIVNEHGQEFTFHPPFPPKIDGFGRTFTPIESWDDKRIIMYRPSETMFNE